MENRATQFRFFQNRTQNILEVSQTLSCKGFDNTISLRIAEAITINSYSISKGKFTSTQSCNIHLVPFNIQWAVIPGDVSEILFLHENYSQALSQARFLAKKNKVKLIMHCCEGKVKDHESFQVNKPELISNI